MILTDVEAHLKLSGWWFWLTLKHTFSLFSTSVLGDAGSAFTGDEGNLNLGANFVGCKVVITASTRKHTNRVTHSHKLAWRFLPFLCSRPTTTMRRTLYYPIWWGTRNVKCSQWPDTATTGPRLAAWRCHGKREAGNGKTRMEHASTESGR
jgi:hypothetical protein